MNADLSFEHVLGSDGERASLVDLSKKGKQFLIAQFPELTMGELVSMPISKTAEISELADKNALSVTMNGDFRW
jgi:hypothetical protein